MPHGCCDLGPIAPKARTTDTQAPVGAGQLPGSIPRQADYFERDFLALAGSDSGTATVPVGIPKARSTASRN